MNYAESFNQEIYCGTSKTYNYQAEVELTTYDFDENKLSEIKKTLAEISFDHSEPEISKVDDITSIKFVFSTNNPDLDLSVRFPGYEVEIIKEQEWEDD